MLFELDLLSVAEKHGVLGDLVSLRSRRVVFDTLKCVEGDLDPLLII